MRRIFVAGHRGMVGSAIVRRLEEIENVEIITAPRATLDLLDQASVREFFEQSSIDEVILAAAKVGGIHANNTFPAQFIYENLQIQNNVIHSAFISGIHKLLFLGSSCIYPRLSRQPINEAYLLSGELEPTNEPYAIAKIAGIKMCESYNREYGCDYRSVMPTNLYGPGDNYHPKNSHVIAALLRRFHNAVQNDDEVVEVWGSGRPRREFLYVDDMADAAVFLHDLEKEKYSSATLPTRSHINVGSGLDVTISQLASLVSEITGFGGRIEFDDTKPDGTPRKLLDVSALKNLGWQSRITLKNGLQLSYRDFLENSVGK